jgi:hypothetical protein
MECNEKCNPVSIPEHWKTHYIIKPDINTNEYISLGLSDGDTIDNEYVSQHNTEYIEGRYYEYINTGRVITDIVTKWKKRLKIIKNLYKHV